jgi:hypothetical protein
MTKYYLERANYVFVQIRDTSPRSFDLCSTLRVELAERLVADTDLKGISLHVVSNYFAIHSYLCHINLLFRPAET